MPVKYILNIALTASRPVKRLIQALFDSVLIFSSIFLAMLTRIENLSFFVSLDFYCVFAITLTITIIVFRSLGLYRAFLRHVSTEIAQIVAIGSLISGGTIFVATFVLGLSIPVTVPITYTTFLFIKVAGIRFVLRTMLRSMYTGQRKNIAIYGAGLAGAQTIQALKSNPEYRVCLVIDDNKNIQGEKLLGQTVYSFENAETRLTALGINTVLLTLPSASRAIRQSIITKLVEKKLEVKTIPDLSNLINGTTEITELKSIVIEDLLGREPVAPIDELMSASIKGKVILVTGAGGSIGSELCRQIIQWQPERLIILDQSEHAIYQLEQETQLSAKKAEVLLTPVVTSVLEKQSITELLTLLQVEIIFHAAAYKHVPLMEQNVLQGLKNNVFGTLAMADCAVQANVKEFVLISTDKAVNPTSFMGVSKRLSEHICQSYQQTQNTTQFSVVRFGNVLGSSGSVIPLFKKQIEAGGPITVTHHDITRYFMTITEAAQLVLQASALTKGGEVFVLDMGKPVRIYDLAWKMVQLVGLKPFTVHSTNKGDILVEITKLRHGEKLHEELSYNDKPSATAHSRIHKANEKLIEVADITVLLEELEPCINQNNKSKAVDLIIRYSPEFRKLAKNNIAH